MINKRIILFFMVLLLISSSCLAACSDTKEPNETTVSAETSSSVEEETTAPPKSIVDGLDFGGREFRIQMSATTLSSNDFMEGLGESTGDIAFDAAYERNLAVSERLNVTMNYTHTDYLYDSVVSKTNKLILAGDDLFDLLVNDQLGFSTSSIEKMFVNVYDCKYFDFTQSCWWDDYMKDLTITNDKMYLLVGDYFIDVLRKSHVIYYNRDIFENLYGDPDTVYRNVLDQKWTYDVLKKYISGAYSDIDGDGTKSKDDRYGMLISAIGGSIFPFEYSSDLAFVTRDAEGIPALTMNNERANLLYEKIYSIYYDEATDTDTYKEYSDELFSKFLSDGSLFLADVSIGNFDKLRDMSSDVGILPYPKLDEIQENYRTVIHDTAEVGAIPLTCGDPDFASAVIQALCEESTKTMIPAYYETALKIKYARDDYSSQMIDIIHDSITGLFPLIYGGDYANNIFTWAFLEPLQKGDISWSSSYEKREEKALIQLQSLIDKWNAE